MLSGSAGSQIEIVEEGKNQRTGVRTLIRRFRKKGYPAPEYTGFVDFDDFVFMCVLFTPESLERKNLRKLRFIVRDAFPMAVRHDHSGKISAAEASIKEGVSSKERAQLLAQIGFWRREMGDLQESRRALEESISLVPNSYYAQQELRRTLTRLGDREAMLQAMGRLLRLDPHNPTVFDECIAYAGSGAVGPPELLAQFKALADDYPEDEHVCANCDFYTGRILIDKDPLTARKHILLARASFRKIFPSDHQVFAALRHALRYLSNAKRGNQSPQV